MPKNPACSEKVLLWTWCTVKATLPTGVWSPETIKNKSKVTLKDEQEWFKKIKKKNRKNLSILTENNILIGNISFTNIKNESAGFHIVIGNRLYWNKGYGYKATLLSLYFAKVNFDINKFYLHVKKNNKYAIAIYKKIGFKFVKSNKKQIFKMKYSINWKLQRVN